MLRHLRFRRLGSRLLLWMGLLLAAPLATTHQLVSRANRAQAEQAIGDALARGARQFEAIAAQREVDLLLAARMMAGDYALRQLFLADELSPATARSALFSYRERIGAPMIVMLDASGAFVADTRWDEPGVDHEAVELLQRVAEASEAYEATGWGFVEGVLYQVVVVPVLAPPPEAVAWLGIGFPVETATARGLRETSALHVSFVAEGDAPRLLASTLPEDQARALLAAGPPAKDDGMTALDLGGERFLTTRETLRATGGERVRVVLQKSLDAELAPARRLELVLLYATGTSLAVGAIAALLLARTLVRPVRRLADHTRRVAAGDYATRIELDRADELGELAQAFNAMGEGLAERDRVRDLLDKNVSPEVAARLLREGAQLGGEERVVTVLFVDLRGFTPLAESLGPRELVALLNRYLDLMGAEIESRGGIIDKFIGDAIMALFGAPESRPDDADRAVQAALGMRAALARLNEEHAGRGLPPLAFGCGINTGVVVAGNVGSSRRLNYTVLGDGVNVAARLEPLTRRADFATDVLVSEATLLALRGRYRTRDLGPVELKGKSGAVRVFAVDGLDA